MLILIGDKKKKMAAQTELECNLKRVLKNQGIRNIGFPGGNRDLPLYSDDDEEVWVAFGGPTGDASVRRYWNAFGLYYPEHPAQSISVEINIAIDSNGGQVAGFFARDSDTNDIFLMHSGKVGGGRLGIGKSAFLVSSKAKLIEVAQEDGGIREGIVVGKLIDPDVVGRIWAFVKGVQSFKDLTINGVLDTPKFKKQVEEFDRYNKEFAGKKRGTHSGAFDYVTYHGEIVQKLYDERTANLAANEKVFNSNLIDLFVTKNGIISEIYEVKTGVGRQMLYTAIGQLLTHTGGGGDKVATFLVVPANESIPEDLQKAIARLGIVVRTFQLKKQGRSRIIELN